MFTSQYFYHLPTRKNLFGVGSLTGQTMEATMLPKYLCCGLPNYGNVAEPICYPGEKKLLMSVRGVLCFLYIQVYFLPPDIGNKQRNRSAEHIYLTAWS